MKTVYLVGGARPNFMKLAPIVRALARQPSLRCRIVHTGQHYDHDMNAVFFRELGIPAPNAYLAAGSGTHAQQTAKIMVAFEEICQQERPDCVLVVGDVNSTLACAVVAKKLCIPVAHVEAGLRSGDRSMPEEINRLVTDAISDWYFATETAAVDNLLLEGKPRSAIHFVGHVMIDNLLYQLDRLLEAGQQAELPSAGLKRGLLERHACFGVVTLHRPSNVDDPRTMIRIVEALRAVSLHVPLVFPVHPRTRQVLDQHRAALGEHIHLTGPLGYMDFLNLWRDALMVLTDSGGLQEETTALGVPCLTLRHNTERPVTVDVGSNLLVGTDPGRIIPEALNILCGKGKKGHRPAFWDGKAAERIAAVLAGDLGAG
jgi:UDP-N-acetylglucosamine 2-epimerase (non-hydrolysing)